MLTEAFTVASEMVRRGGLEEEMEMLPMQVP